ncbi:MAG: ATP-binding protein [Chloroflexi bacterium]|nr:ATP-binding protein [Chloroflexota bacterium]
MAGFDNVPNSFRIGRTAQQDEPVVLEARDLTTHAVILGMTGSGKTGLGTVLLEEAALDGIPQLIIDPKGDMTNLLLASPELNGDEFEAWVPPEDVPQDQSQAVYAAEVAEEWKDSLQDWDIGEQQIRAYRNSAVFSIYTPGTDSGLPLSVFSSFEAPDVSWQGNHDMLRERISRLVSALLILIGVRDNDPEDPEHILLANIFEYNWRNNVDVTIERLIQQAQQPPFEELGALDLDVVISKKQRDELVRSLNKLLAAPNFRTWVEGAPLDIPTLLRTSEGKPRVSIISTAHLGGEAQQFITAAVLEQILMWMGSLSGTNQLRAIVYLDEVHGMLPPYPNKPPTKEPLMRLLKQARAFGVGVVLTTQNPADIDYKALSNIGTWFIGKLQTANDRRRVLEGLSDANDAEGSLSPSDVKDLLGDLDPRQFVLNSIYEPESPYQFTTRHAMSYLRGPLGRDQIRSLMAEQRAQPAPGTRRPRNVTGMRPPEDSVGRAGGQLEQEPGPAYSGEREAGAAPTLEDAPPGFSPVQPTLSRTVTQYFLPAELTREYALSQWSNHIGEVSDTYALFYRPSLLAQVTVQFSHSQSNSTDKLWYAFAVPHLPDLAYLEWGRYQTWPFDPQTLETDPLSTAYYGDIPPMLASGSGFTDLRNGLEEWLYTRVDQTILHNRPMNIYGRLGEADEVFYERVQTRAKENLNEELDEVAEKYDRRLDRSERRRARKASRLEA